MGYIETKETLETSRLVEVLTPFHQHIPVEEYPLPTPRPDRGLSTTRKYIKKAVVSVS